nr:PREDICTED: DNA replication ATP-dependent helicase/nuclease DNA2 [Bemisia tabaci]
MKKTSLKAKSQNASSTSSKQMKLDSFFNKKHSPNKENLKDNQSSIVSSTPFLCLSDKHGDESVIDSSITISKEIASKSEDLHIARKDSTEVSALRNKKRKSSGLLDLKDFSEDESFVESSLKEPNVSCHSKTKKINLDISTKRDASISFPWKDFKESNVSNKETTIVTDKKHSKLKHNKCLARQHKSEPKSFSTLDSNCTTSESPSNPNVSNSHNKKSSQNEQNKKFQSPEIKKNIPKSSPKTNGKDTLSSTPMRGKKPKPDTPYPCLKPASNITSILFESVKDSKSQSPNTKQNDTRSLSDSSIKSVISGSPQNSSKSKKESPLATKNKSFQSTESDGNMPKSTPKRREKPEHDTPYPSLRSVSNITSILFESVENGKIQPRNSVADDDCCLSKSISQSALQFQIESANKSSQHSNISSNSNKTSPLNEGNERLQSPKSCKDIPNRTPARREKTKPDTPYPFLKPASNVTSVLFETTSDCKIQSEDPKSSSNSYLSGSNIESALKSRALFSKLKVNSKSASPSSHETPKRISTGSSIQHKKNEPIMRKSILNSSEPLFEDTPLKSCQISMNVCKAESVSESESSPMFMDSQSELNRKGNSLTKQSGNDSLWSASSGYNTRVMFDSPVETNSATKSFSDSSFPSIISCTVGSSGTVFLTPPDTANFSSNVDEMSPRKNQCESKSAENNLLVSVPQHPCSAVKTQVSRVGTEALEATLNRSCDSIVESSQPDSAATSMKDKMADEVLCDGFEEDLIFDDWDFSSQNLSKPLMLETMKRCKITDIQSSNCEKSISVQLCEDESAQTVCKLREAWYHTNLSVSNIVNIMAEYRENEWIIDNTNGLLILSPDTLISGTTLMGSMFCRRRAVLANSFPTVEAGAKCMVIGSSVHLLLQKVMQNNIRCVKKIQQIIEEIVSDPGLIHQLLLSEMEFEEMKRELSNFSPNILDFMETYVFPKKGSNSGNMWNGKITSIKDIEENIWSPTFGMKGKVDVTVEVNAGGQKKIMPFELKTGKSSNSAEHRGQVILYVMMMAQLGYDTDSGLLFYLKDGQMKDVKVDHKVKRDIMMLRNDFVHNIMSSQKIAFDEDGSISGPILPGPINHHSACAKCPYLTLCCATLADNGMRGVHPKNSLTNLATTALGHLKSSHISYVFHWAGLLKIEEADKKSRNTSGMKDLWCLSAEKREETGMCVANLSLSKVDHVGDTFIHTFKFPNPNISNNFTTGDYVIISSKSRPAVVTGSIVSTSEHAVSISLDKDLRLREEKIFHMDRYESQTLLNFNMSSLCALLNDSPRAGQLRQAIVELKLPSFNNVSPALPSNLTKKLNNGQKKAVMRAFQAESYMLIEGMPGCGKTETLASLVKLLVKNGKSVLVTSHTHSAVDNLALRLQDLDLLRLGKKAKINPSLHRFSEEVLLSKSKYKTVEDVRQLYLSKSIIAVTVLGCSHPLFSFRRFDVCIVDEATQVLQPSTLKPLIAADKFILVGDPLQLPPLVLSDSARSLGLSESLFVRLSRPAVTVILNTQYRMNSRITSVANQFMYQGALKCANESVANNTLNLSSDVSGPLWLERALSCKLEHSVVFVDIRDSNSDGEVFESPTEAKVLMIALESMRSKGISDESIGVIAAYRAQVNLLCRLTEERKFKIEVNTIDQYQGRDKDIILFSCSARASASDGGILSSKQRLSVAITRSKQKLIFFGNSTLLKTYKTFERILECIGDDCIVRA